jgi:predicted esterase
MPSFTQLRLLGLSLVLVAGAACAARHDARLPHLQLDAGRVAVVGLSSGAYMATQAQLAYPDIFPNAALVAGGPYGCAGGNLQTALSSCMKGAPAIDVDALVANARKRAAAGEIGPLNALAKAHVYLLHGKADGVVAPAVAEAGAQFYQRLRDGNARSPACR